MKIAVFCSANKNIDPDFFTITEEMGKWMAENGHDLVFGGCNSGLMDCIGKAVKAIDITRKRMEALGKEDNLSGQGTEFVDLTE